MSDVRNAEGDFAVNGARFGIVLSRFNSFIGERLLEGAIDALMRHGAERSHIEVVRVPGAFEIPVALKQMAATKKFAALIALGCVIRGETPHFEYVAGEATRGIGQVGLQFDIPIGNGVLTVNTVEQAMERAGTNNKGADAALAAAEMVNIMKKLRN